jgi:glycerol-3-phosphate dehydrogenase
LVIKIGMALYDAYSGRRRTVPKHTFRSRRKSLEMFPHLNPEVIFTATYYDGAMPTPERICMDLIWDAEEASDQAWAVNYMPAIGAQRDSVQLRDEIGGKVYSVEPEVVINAAGPWIDFVNHDLGRTSNFIGGTKGSHLVLNHPELREAIHDHEFFFENKDGRIVLIFPLLDKILIGTSDIRIEDPDEARCTEEEIDYFFEMIARVFPDIHVDRSHIVYRFSGVRPLPTEKRGLTGQISRDHSIEILDTKDVLGFPILSLVGGKWTSFRAFSEQVSEAVLEILNQSRRVSTKDLAIGGGKGFPQDEETKSKWLHATAEKTGLTGGRLDTLLKRYGTRAEEIATFITQGEDQPLKHHPEFSRREVLFIAQRERVLHLEDFALRRSNLVKLGQLSPGLARELGEILGPMLGWSQGMKDREISRALEVTEFPS